MQSSCLVSIMARCVGAALMLAAMPAVAQVGPQGQRALMPEEQDWLIEHNLARAEAGLGPLRWSPALVRDAKDWADTLAQRGAFQHDPDLIRRRQGENLWQGTRGYYAPSQMIGLFVAEKRNFRPGTFPDVSRTGRWSDVGHYTQVIWPDTREVGCATAANTRDQVLVCRYFPAGNVMGTRLDPAMRLSRR